MRRIQDFPVEELKRDQTIWKHHLTEVTNGQLVINSGRHGLGSQL